MRLTLQWMGLIGVMTGLFGFLAPAQFFDSLAAYTGAANLHLTRDVGAAYLSAGLGLYWAGRVPRWRAPLVCVAAVFLSLHALGHIIDLVEGRVGLGHIVVDAVQVFAPALLVSGLGLHFLRDDARRRAG